MVSTIDKILILRGVSLFAHTPDEILAEVPTEELHIQAGETIFEKGDHGTSMYIVVAGRLRAHDGDMTLNYLNTGNIFGEMAALDPEARSASVTAVEDTHLFRIDREPLYDLMAGQVEVVQGVVHVLCQRLRARVRDLASDFEYMQNFARVTSAATAVEAGIFQPESLDEVAQRTDELGQLARVFQRMTRQVYAREQQLKQQVHELRIEIDHVKQARQVSEITEGEYFRDLQRKVQDMRNRPKS
ncbi:MAG TPA: cyclic nucleotide-binding domain-containing protein [Chloroflexia bacterium]|nr:cyclic nucleotide-binding domain-containing protein [Chloroflexia bacterium]